MALLLFLTFPPACSGGGSDNSSSNSNDDNSNGNDDNSNGNGDDNNNDNDNLPGVPTSLMATANGSSVIDLTWQAPADDGGSDIAGYQIEHRQDSDGDWADAEVDTGDTESSYSHAPLQAETNYSYRVSAINANGTGPASDVAMATTTSLADDPNPGIPTGLTATPGNGEVTLA